MNITQINDQQLEVLWLHYIILKKAHILIFILCTFLKMQILENTCHNYAKLSYKFMKVKQHLELL
jgi:hypothetical protein